MDSCQDDLFCFLLCVCRVVCVCVRVCSECVCGMCVSGCVCLKSMFAILTGGGEHEEADDDRF